MVGHGGARAGAGRPAGQANKATRELKSLAQQYTDEAIAALAEIVRDKAASTIARVKAVEALLDRGHGRPTQHIEAKISPLEELSDDELMDGIAALREALVY
jgi:hypothetical protein